MGGAISTGSGISMIPFDPANVDITGGSITGLTELGVGTSLSDPGAITFSKDPAATNLGPTVISSSWGGGGNGGNPFLYFGYNIDAPGWNFINDNDPAAAFWGVEGNYDDVSANNKMEMYAQWQFAEGMVGVTYRRSFMAQFDKVTTLPTFTQVNAGILFGVDLNYTDGTGTDSQKITGKQAFNAGQNGTNTSFLPITFNDTAAFQSTARFNSTVLPGSNPTWGGNVAINSGQTDASVNGLEFKSATTGSGFGYRLATVYDGGSNIDLIFQRRANSATWTNSALIKGGTGAWAFPAGTGAAPSITFQSDATKGLFDPGSNAIDVSIAGASQARFGSNGTVTLFSNGGSNFNSFANDGATDVLALKRSTNAQEFRVYDTFSSTSNYSRASLKCFTTSITLSGASTTATNLIPAKTNVICVNAKVTTAITGATGYQLGDGSDVDRWGDIIGTTTTTESDMSDATANPSGWFGTANNVVATAKTSNFTGGQLYICVWALQTEAD